MYTCVWIVDRTYFFVGHHLVNLLCEISNVYLKLYTEFNQHRTHTAIKMGCCFARTARGIHQDKKWLVTVTGIDATLSNLHVHCSGFKPKLQRTTL